MSAVDYRGYSQWKHWEPAEFMSCPPEQARYFEGECLGIDLNGARVVELGFGNGSFLRFAKDRGSAVSGTELLDVAVASAKAAGVPVHSLDLSDAVAAMPGGVDLVAAFDVFEHLTHAELLQIFDALAKLLKPGGQVIARFPNGQSPLGRVPQYGDHTHRSVLSPQLLMQLLIGQPWVLQRAGNPFAVVSGYGVLKQAGLRGRLMLKRLAERTINRLYGLDITLDPNVVVVLRRT